MEAENFPDIGQVMTDDVSVMIFTSGSTGSPKGALHSTFSLLKIASICIKTIGLTDEDRICVILPLYHILGFMLSLIAGTVKDAILVLPGIPKSANSL